MSNVKISTFPDATTMSSGDRVTGLQGGVNVNFSQAQIKAGAGTVTSVATGTGLTGGPITTTGTVVLADTAVTPGSFTNSNITVDQQGRITAAANGSGGSPQLPVYTATSGTSIGLYSGVGGGSPGGNLTLGIGSGTPNGNMLITGIPSIDPAISNTIWRAGNILALSNDVNAHGEIDIYSQSNASGNGTDIELHAGSGSAIGGVISITAGGSSGISGGSLNLFAGGNSGYVPGQSYGGIVNISGGGGYTGGGVTIKGATGSYGNGGSVLIYSGRSNRGNYNGGDIQLSLGNGHGTGHAGNLVMFGLPNTDPSFGGAIWSDNGVLVQSGSTIPAGQLPVYTGIAGNPGTSVAITAGAGIGTNINGGALTVKSGDASATGYGTGGILTVQAGIGGSTGYGGDLYVNSGNGYNGGTLHFIAGHGVNKGGGLKLYGGYGTGGSGGGAIFKGGSCYGANGNGGPFYLYGGNPGSSTGYGGGIYLKAGGRSSGTGTGGDIKLHSGGGSGGGKRAGNIYLYLGASGGGASNGNVVIQNIPTTDPIFTNAVFSNNKVLMQSGVTNFSGTITTGSLVGKTITVVNGIITSFV